MGQKQRHLNHNHLLEMEAAPTGTQLVLSIAYPPKVPFMHCLELVLAQVATMQAIITVWARLKRPR